MTQELLPRKIKSFIDGVTSTPFDDSLKTLEWEFGEGDNNHWRILLENFKLFLNKHIKSRNDLHLYDDGFSDSESNPPFPKNAILEILRVTRLIFQNCNVTVHSLEDHFSLLLASTDSDVVEACLQTLVQLKEIDAVTSCILRSSLEPLSKGWGRKEEGLGLVSWAKEEIADPLGFQLGCTLRFEFGAFEVSPDDPGNICKARYYKKVINMADVGSRNESDLELLDKLVTEYKVYPSDRFPLLTRLRFARAFASPASRHQYTCIGLNAFVALVRTFRCPEDLASYLEDEPDFINDLVLLLTCEDAISEKVRYLSVLSLLVISEDRSWQPNVLTALMSAGHQGILSGLMQKAIESAVNNASEWSVVLAEALLSLIKVLMPSSDFSALNVAEFLPILLLLLKDTDQHHLRLVTTAVHVLETFTGYSNTAKVLFRNLGGLDVAISRFMTEVSASEEGLKRQSRSDVAIPETSDSQVTAKHTVVLDNMHQGMISYHRLLLVKALRRAVSREACVSEEGLLPHCLHIIFKRAKDFGGRVFSLSASVMSDLIRDDPTCFPKLEAANLPSAFLDAIMDDVLCSAEVISSILWCLDALCLTNNGLQAVEERGALRCFVKVFTSKVYLRVLTVDKIDSLSTGFIELLCHSASLRSTGVDMFIEILNRIKEIASGLDFSASTKLLRLCQLVPMEIGSSGWEDVAVLDDIDATKPENIEQSSDLLDTGIMYVDSFLPDCIINTARLLETVLQNSDICRIFIEKKGIESVLQLLTLPLPPLSVSLCQSLAIAFKNFSPHHSNLLAHTVCTFMKEHLKFAAEKLYWGSWSQLVQVEVSSLVNIFSLCNSLLKGSTSFVSRLGSADSDMLKDLGRVYKETVWQVSTLSSFDVEEKWHLNKLAATIHSFFSALVGGLVDSATESIGTAMAEIFTDALGFVGHPKSVWRAVYLPIRCQYLRKVVYDLTSLTHDSRQQTCCAVMIRNFYVRGTFGELLAAVKACSQLLWTADCETGSEGSKQSPSSLLLEILHCCCSELEEFERTGLLPSSKTTTDRGIIHSLFGIFEAIDLVHPDASKFVNQILQSLGSLIRAANHDEQVLNANDEVDDGEDEDEDIAEDGTGSISSGGTVGSDITDGGDDNLYDNCTSDVVWGEILTGVIPEEGRDILTGRNSGVGREISDVPFERVNIERQGRTNRSLYERSVEESNSFQHFLLSRPSYSGGFVTAADTLKELEGEPLLDADGLKVLIDLLRLPQPLGGGLLQRLLLKLCSHVDIRATLVRLLMDVIKTENLGGGLNQINSLRQYGCQADVECSRSQVCEGDPPLLLQNALEVLTYLATNLTGVANLLFHFDGPSTPESVKVDHSGVKNVSRKGKVMEDGHHLRLTGSSGGDVPLLLLLKFLSQQKFVQSISHLEQVLSLVQVIVYAAASKAECRSNAEKPAAPDRSVKVYEIILRIPASDLCYLCSLLGRGGLSDKVYTLVREVLTKLAAVAAPHCKYFISELAILAQGLSTFACSELVAFRNTNMLGLDVGSAVLRVLQILSSLTSGWSNDSGDKVEDMEQEEGAMMCKLNVALEPLWNELSKCMSAMELELSQSSLSSVPNSNIGDQIQGPLPHGMQRLFPFIEGFFVLCGKQAGNQMIQQDHNNATSREFKENVGSSLSSSSNCDESSVRPDASVFLRFAEKHRRLLNAFVRQNHSLLENSLSPMLKAPRLIDFDNKKAYFRSRVSQEHVAHLDGPLTISVRREYILEDSYDQLRMVSSQRLRGLFKVHFEDEEGIDVGGLTREWYRLLCRAIFDKGRLLFSAVGINATFQPNPNSVYQTEHLSYFRFAGRVVAKALYDGQLLDVYFTRSFYKHIIGVKVSYHDIESVDPDHYKNLKWMMENDVSGIPDLVFSMDADEEKRILSTEAADFELKPGGRNIRVTEETKQEYVDLVADHILTNSILAQINAFLEGFYELVPKALVSIFNDKELEMLMSCLPEIDLEDLKANTEYTGYTADCSVIQWFWEVVDGFSQQDRARLLQFVTATSKAPLEGFKTLQGASGIVRFQVCKAYGAPQRLPSAHTCYNQLDLPEYSSKELLQERLLLAIREGNEGFGFR